jgi:hypothetical protein
LPGSKSADDLPLLIPASWQLPPLDPFRGEGNRLAACGDLIEKIRREEARIPDYKITKLDDLLPWNWRG